MINIKLIQELKNLRDKKKESNSLSYNSVDDFITYLEAKDTVIKNIVKLSKAKNFNLLKYLQNKYLKRLKPHEKVIFRENIYKILGQLEIEELNSIKLSLESNNC